MVVAEHRRRIDGDDGTHARQPVDQRQDLVDILLILRDEDRGATVAHLVFDFRRCSGRIDAVHDGAERLRREVADQPFLADVAHNGDALALRDAECREGLRGLRDKPCVVAEGAFAIDAEMFGAERNVVRSTASALAQQRRGRGSAQGVPTDRSRSAHHPVPACCPEYSIAQLKTQYVSAGEHSSA